MTAHIQIGDIRPRIQYVGDGTQTAFPYPFPVFSEGDLRVYLDDTRVTSGFSVTGAGESDGGTVTFASAPASGARVTLVRHLDIQRVTDFQAGGPLRAAALNDALDTLTAVDQQLDDGLRRTVRLAPGAGEDADLTLPAPAPGAILGWNATATALVNDPLNTAGLTDAIAAVMDASGVAGEIPGLAARAETWADDAALSAWMATVSGGGGAGDGVGPGDDITVASLTITGTVSVGGALVVAGSAMSVWGQSLMAAADAAGGRTLLDLGSAATTQAADYATAVQGLTADSAVQPGDSVRLATVDYTVGRFIVGAASVGASHTVDLGDGEFRRLTLTDDTAFTLPDPPAGRGYSITLKLIQDATGSRAPTFAQADATAAKWLGGAAPPWRTGAGAFDLVTLTHDGTDLIAAHVGGVG
ncbi:hypothetical protein [Rhodospira trueperi]|uniref:Phage T7 tail fibre protein n=1 Tax=Rhodospira trueperi TaxID=69960 RepID=A0A1G6YHF1_9PROT|nr:hypothetical protein [Rhodospira trueperi]SDD89423.1 Phage T7 tail fibre protein [Rhodospira trueperi]